MSHYVLSNALFASAVAAAVFVCSRFIRNASIIHLLWAVVLLRFLAPPLVDVPIRVALPNSDNAAITAPAGRPDSSLGTLSANVRLSDSRPAPESGVRVIRLSQLAALIWAAGAIVVLALATMRALRLRSLARRTASKDEALQRHVQRISNEMGLRYTPNAFLVRAKISPMVWTWFSRPLMLLPLQLWNTLSEDEKTAVLRHEVAHLIRRDHWVRVVEALATVTHWWCPVLWWARRELHRYEERCCDAMAASAGPQSRAALARACLQTVDFIGHESPSSFHFGVSRITGFHSFRQRLLFILEGEHVHTIPRRVTAGLFLVVPLVLGVSLKLAEASGHTATDSNPEVVAIADSFERMRVTGRVDVDVRFGTRQKVTVSNSGGPAPHFEVNDQKKLMITLDESRVTQPEQSRPKVVITSPSMAAIEAMQNAAVSVHKVKTGNMLIVVEGAQVTADGHCDALAVNADKSGSLLAREMTVDNAIVTASHESTIELGTVGTVIQKSDPTSRVTLYKERNVGLVRVRNQ